MSNLTAIIEGNDLVIRIPVVNPPEPSASGKTLVVASSRGNVATSVMVQGKKLTIGLNAYIAR